MALTPEQITAQNFKNFYESIKPYLNGSPSAPQVGYTPIGTIISVMGNTAPKHYLACDGAVYNIAEYQELATYFADQFGSANYFGGDGTTTFAVPDLRGEFLRGTGTNSHTDQGSGANVGAHQNGTTTFGFYSDGNTFQVCAPDATFAGTNADAVTSTGHGWNVFNKSSTSGSGFKYAGKVRPTNTAVLYCIAYTDIFIALDSNRPVQSIVDRWLRFDPSNHKGVIIKEGTSILNGAKNVITFSKDTAFDLSSFITNADNGKDFFIFMEDNGDLSASTDKNHTGVLIGRFHTLCVAAGTMTMIAPASPSSGLKAGDTYLVKPYTYADDPDFYQFYNKTITSVSVGSKYDVITMQHPLSGYVAGDILPESIFCTTFKPNCLYEDAMVYDKGADICVDIYLQSGTGFNTRSAYNATHTVSREPSNIFGDFRSVGKRLLTDEEFTTIAIGSNETNNITGNSDKTTVGGHVNTNNRRMLSATGVEECCGYLWQVLSTVGVPGGTTTWVSIDNQNSFGKSYSKVSHVLLAGCSWNGGENCGTRSRNTNFELSGVDNAVCGRGCTSIIRSTNPSASKAVVTVKQVENYSLEEQVIGTWIDGKPLYRKYVTFTTPSSTANTIVLTLDSTIRVKLFDGVIGSADAVQQPLNFYDTANYHLMTYFESGYKLRCSAGSGELNINGYVVIQYTKTTD